MTRWMLSLDLRFDYCLRTLYDRYCATAHPAGDRNLQQFFPRGLRAVRDVNEAAVPA